MAFGSNFGSNFAGISSQPSAPTKTVTANLCVNESVKSNLCVTDSIKEDLCV